jgi:hypothetical protein
LDDKLVERAHTCRENNLITFEKMIVESAGKITLQSKMHHLKKILPPSMVVHTCNLSSLEAEAGGPFLCGLPEL